MDTVAIEGARSVLTATRVELQRRAGRELNKLLLQEQEQVARAMGMVDADELMYEVASAGRTVAWEGDDAWRRRGAWSRAQDTGGRWRCRPHRPGPRRPARPTGPYCVATAHPCPGLVTMRHVDAKRRRPPMPRCGQR